MLTYPDIDPTLLKIGPLQIQWYGFMYILGIICGTQFCKHYLKKLNYSIDEIYNLVTYIITGMLLGGRLGYVIFYNLSFYLSNPSKIVAIWEGGMSYHGGAIGCIVAIIIYCRLHNRNFLAILDLMAIGSTFGVFFGRIGNFINGELFGRPTNFILGMVFPNGGPIPRHPSQLYEAFFEGFVSFWLLYFFLKKANLKPGYLFCINIFLYGTFRFILEYFREPDSHLGFILGPLTTGQCLSIGILIFGFSLSHYLYHYYYKKT